MTLYTIGFTKKTAEEFFSLLRKNSMDLVLDIRLNNKSQLAGFSKGEDLAYFLHEICQCHYEHCIEFAPTKEILDEYKNKKITWLQYEKLYISLMNERKDYLNFASRYMNYSNICFLCSELTADKCHRRLITELIAKNNENIIIKHI
jgi:uncharacterized protein (DUF488 family)